MMYDTVILKNKQNITKISFKCDKFYLFTVVTKLLIHITVDCVWKTEDVDIYFLHNENSAYTFL